MFVVLHGEESLKLFHTECFALAIGAFETFDSTYGPGKVATGLVKPDERRENFVRLMSFGQFFIEVDSLLIFGTVGQISGERLFIIRIVGC